MFATRKAPAVLDRQFLETRAKILQVAADLDRLDRAEGSIEGDPRMAQLHEAIQALLADAPNRAEQVQMICSRGYDSDWKGQFGIQSPSAK